MRANARLLGNISKLAIAVIQEEPAGGLAVKLGVAILRLALVSAIGFLLAVPRDVIDDEQIEQSIVVDVDPCASDCPKRPVLLIRLGHAGFFRQVGERAVSIVVVESVAINA